MGVMFKRADAEGPGCHAFIVGVSAYPHESAPAMKHLGLSSLPSAARSAFEVYRWISDASLAVPLASVRLLIAPAEDEVLPESAAPCTLENFLRDASEWRADASRHRDSLTIFYFAGHGFSPTQGEQFLALQDFGDGIGPLLRNAVSVNNLVYGMAPDVAGDVARTQLYFIDANRVRLASLSEYQTINATAVFDAPLRGSDDRTAPIFYATSPDEPAYTYSTAQTLFSQALVEGLGGAAVTPTEDGRWCVSVLSLARYLPERVEQLAREGGVSQIVGVEGSLGEAVISYLSGPPTAEIAVDIEPGEPADDLLVELFDGDGQTVGEWREFGPHHQKVPAGLYQIDVTGTRGGTPFRKRKVVDARPSRLNVLNIRL